MLIASLSCFSMVFPDADEAIATAVDHAVGVAEVDAFRRDGSGLSARIVSVHTLIGVVHEEDHAVGYPEAQSAVLVHARPDVEGRRINVRGRAVRRASDDYVPSALVRAHLDPVDIVSVQLDRAQAH